MLIFYYLIMQFILKISKQISKNFKDKNKYKQFTFNLKIKFMLFYSI